MFVAKSIQSDHKDLIHDVSYDFHGRRMATCSSDQTVKIWDQGEDGEWTCSASWKTHSGSVWRVTWAHPEYGQVVATCSFDRTAAVWEEMVGEVRSDGQHRSWIKRASLVDSRTSVTDVKFAPKHLGLQLATCSTDGIVRIYEAPDVMNLSQWSLQYEISCKLRCSCLSWNPSRRHPPMLAVGSNDANTAAGGKVQIHEYNDATRKWNKVETIAMVTDAVHDVAFAPNLGRSYHLLGIATKTLKIITIEPLRRDATLSGQTGLTKFELRQVGDFNDHDSQVWRICWNVIGTVLVSSGDDSCVRMWKGNYLGNWKCISVMKGDGTRADAVNRSQQMMNSQEFGKMAGQMPARTHRRQSDVAYHTEI
ncbi:nucleoporin SEH1-like isoform X4 [Mercenaria mercenaria]|uniref:nucleoporin SEH1-like isoform X4 n=1 Tax=Mercenaria mercenaria TaxID=6596 RepID=UPI001E1D7E86|nr:nucleoporin SEH1-like isoform X4 [Mercenaria mercenaria]XP_045193807.1 nucleoporin SEH1-like isoform X4 [Mercenaria mercenaria]